jgi:uncharacterized coiled-coil protein SlyX
VAPILAVIASLIVGLAGAVVGIVNTRRTSRVEERKVDNEDFRLITAAHRERIADLESQNRVQEKKIVELKALVDACTADKREMAVEMTHLNNQVALLRRRLEGS